MYSGRGRYENQRSDREYNTPTSNMIDYGSKIKIGDLER